MAGILLTGINEDRITDGCRHFKPPRDFFSIPIFLSSGDQDRIATPDQQLAVENSMRRTGFTNIRHKTFAGGHEGSMAHVFEALRWFRSGIEDRHKVPSAKPLTSTSRQPKPSDAANRRPSLCLDLGACGRHF